jgi:hypothetical protein
MDISSIPTRMRTKLSRSRLLTLGTYISGFLLALAGPIWVHRLRPSDLRYPFRVLDSDLPSIYSLAQALSESWFSVVHDSLGAPKTADWALTFVPEDTFLLMLRFLVKVTGDPIVAVNTFYVLSFGLSALSFMWLSDRLDMRRRVSFPLAVIYAWLPYHFTRMEDGHVFLAAYFMLPLGVWVLLRLYHYVTGSRPNFLPVRHHHRVLFVLLVLAIGGSGTYYALFLALLAISTALLIWVKDRSRAVSLRHIGWCIGTTFLFLLPAVLRNIWAASNGRVTQLTRSPDESLVFGGALHRLLLPWGVWLPDPAKAAVSKTEF